MYYVVEGIHTDPNNKDTLDPKTKKEYGPMAKITAEDLAVALIQKNIDDYYHRAWVIEK
tara:strand:- start:2472 stop:2648 length:177 start_codon:yes stop_codon:yes gene_type:complete